jgi:23S rRNA (guanosine2251-2'-O)-methyltransferase
MGDHRGNKPGPDPDRLIIGRQPVLESMRRGRPVKVYLAEGLKGAPIEEIVALAGEKGIPHFVVSRSELDHLARGCGSHQGVAALAAPFRYLSLAELIAAAKKDAARPFLLLLDHLQDPQNLGSIIRTADAAGVHGLIIPEPRAAGITPAVRKVAAGAVERARIARVKNLAQAARILKQEGFWIYGAEADGAKPYYAADYKVPLALVAGSEGRGLAPLVRRHCDQIIRIPMQGCAGSLNVAVAVAVISFAVLAQREGWH